MGRADFSTTSTDHHAFLWKNGVMTDLGTVAGQTRSTAEGINSKGQVVGDANGNGWLWENGSIVDLNTLVLPGATLHVAGAAAINDLGEIVAGGLPTDGSEHVILLIPCDENHADDGGCDYSLVDTTTAAGIHPAQTIQTSAGAVNETKSSPSEMTTRTSFSRVNRNRRFGVLQQE